MGALLNDPALLEDDNQVGVADCGQPVGNDKGGPALHQAVHTVLDDLLGPGINGAGRFIQNQDRRIRDGGPGNGKELPLALGQVGAVSGQLCIIALGEPADKAVRVGQSGGRVDLLVRGVQLAVADPAF